MISDGDRGAAVRQRIGVLDVGQMRDAPVRTGLRRPQEKIVMEKALAVRLLVRVENRLSVMRPPR